ncbi:hypothetical protein DL93DRAFT_2173324 [Clavulina sp. PMI_390]|nr:hypothetical protein DL93DRAFT_2173324 [Clavulina sp. PMI_390]
MSSDDIFSPPLKTYYAETSDDDLQSRMGDYEAIGDVLVELFGVDSEVASSH